MVSKQAEDVLIDIAAEEAQAAGGGLKALKDITKELEGMIPPGQGAMALLSTADKIPVWNVHSGRRSDILSDQLRFQLSKRFPRNHPLAGQRVYSMVEVEGPVLPKLKCWLHPEHEMRGWLDGIGLRGRTCMSDSIPTEYAVNVHMQRKHSTAYNLIVDERSKEVTREQNDLQRAQLAAMERLAGTAHVKEHSEGPKVHHCRTEGCTRFFDTERGRDMHERKEHKE